MSEVTEKYYDDWICIWNEDYSKIPSLISDDFVGHWPTRDIHGPSELESIIKMTRDCFYNIEFKTILTPILDDQRVSGYWEMNALYHGNMEGAKVEKGTPISFRGMDILIFKDDKCVEYYVLSDMFSLMKQLQAIKT